jgi:protein-disulfide isomerase
MRRLLLIAGAASMALAGSVGHLEAQVAQKPAAAQEPAAAKKKSDLEEIKDTQRTILDRLDAQYKVLASILQKVQAAPQAGRPQVDPNKVYAIPVTASSAIRGPKDASVTLVEFSDYQCPFCSQTTSLVDQLLAAYPKDVRLVMKQFPLTSIHQNAMNASKAAIAAGKQGKFWEMHDELFKNNRALTVDDLKKYATQLGLDAAKFETDMNSPETAKLIDEETGHARAADVTGTPSLFINGKRVMNRSIEGMKAMVDEELKKAKPQG